MKLSFVIPLYNEEESLQMLQAQIVEAVKALGHEFEIIFVDDGSTDGSYQVLKQLHAENDYIKVLRFRRNFGKAAALMAGFAEVEGEIVFTLDADLQDDPAEIPNFLAKLDEGYDLVGGWKYPRLDPITKTAPSRLYNAVVRAATKIKMHDFNCGFKAMRKEAVDELNLYGELHRYIPVLAHWRGFRVTEIKVKHHPRKYGISKYGLSRFWRGMFDFITVYFLTGYTRRPMHFFGWIGLLTFATGLVINGYLSIIWFSGELIGNRPLLTLGTLLIIVGAQFFSFGLLAELLTSGIHSRESEYTIVERLD